MRLSFLLIALIMIAFVFVGCVGSSIYLLSPTDAEQTEVSAPPILDSDFTRPDLTDISTFRLNETELTALEVVAGIRSGLGLPELGTDETLCALAYIRAKESYTHFSHTRPDGQDYSTVFSEYGYAVTGSAEVLLRKDSQMSMEEFFSVWNIDPDVAQYFADPTFVKVGLAIYHKDNYDILVCLLVK